MKHLSAKDTLPYIVTTDPAIDWWATARAMGLVEPPKEGETHTDAEKEAAVEAARERYAESLDVATLAFVEGKAAVVHKIRPLTVEEYRACKRRCAGESETYGQMAGILLMFELCYKALKLPADADDEVVYELGRIVYELSEERGRVGK